MKFLTLDKVGWKGKFRMEIWTYIVEKIDGDYAYLKRTDITGEELKLVARAILPPEITEGTRLSYELFEYTVME